MKAFAQIIKAYFIYIFSEYNFIYVSTGDEKCLVTFLMYVSSGNKNVVYLNNDKIGCFEFKTKDAIVVGQDLYWSSRAGLRGKT